MGNTKQLYTWEIPNSNTSWEIQNDKTFQSLMEFNEFQVPGKIGKMYFDS